LWRHHLPNQQGPRVIENRGGKKNGERRRSRMEKKGRMSMTGRKKVGKLGVKSDLYR